MPYRSGHLRSESSQILMRRGLDQAKMRRNRGRPQRNQMNQVDCKDCRHFKSAPYEARIDGCFHSDHMKVVQKDNFLNEQETPGNHRAINRRGDCASFEGRAPSASLLDRILRD
jgi:hypothetical protein